MCVCVCIRVHVCACVRVCVCAFMCACMWACVCLTPLSLVLDGVGSSARVFTSALRLSPRRHRLLRADPHAKPRVRPLYHRAADRYRTPLGNEGGNGKGAHSLLIDICIYIYVYMNVYMYIYI